MINTPITVTTPKPVATTALTARSACGCPVCRGLQLFEAPKYATGALLTADDLSSEQAFVRAKMRLHNRELHGWGTVCGLKVVCNDCAGSVTVEPGYALDPCGNDLVLAQPARFDVVKAIQACRDAKRPKIGDCDPYVPPSDPGCADLETHWCVTLKFKEVESAYAVALARQPAGGGCGCGGGSSSGGGCGCGGSSSSSGAGGCGCSGTSSGSSGTAVLATTGTGTSSLGLTSPGCAPRRLVECVEIGLSEHAGPCAPKLKLTVPRREDQQLLEPAQTKTSFGSGLAKMIPKDGLLGRILTCGEQAIKLLESRLTEADAKALTAVSNGDDSTGISAQAMHDALCRLRQALLDYLALHDPVRCRQMRAAGKLTVPSAGDFGGNQGSDGYAESAQPVFENMVGIWVQAAGDCVCGALLPPCPPDPMDMRVPIACLTVRGDTIVDVCNHACRRYAGSFPALGYWLSIVPIAPLISRGIAMLCCAADFVMKPREREQGSFAATIDRIDPTKSWRKAVSAGGFAAPRKFMQTVAKIDVGGLASKVLKDRRIEPVSAAPALGATPDAAVADFKQQGIDANVVEMDQAPSADVTMGTLGSMIVARGKPLTLYSYQGKVVGFSSAAPAQPAAAAAAAPAQTGEMDALRAQVADLHARISKLEPGSTS